MNDNFAELRKRATARETEYLDALEKHGSQRAAAEALGCSRGTLSGALERVRRRAVIAPRGTPGFSPRELTTHYDANDAVTGSTVKEVPTAEGETGGIGAGPQRDGHSGYLVKGVSTYFDAEGAPRGQWVKTKIDADQREAVARKFFETLAASVHGLSPIVAAPARVEDDLLTVYPFGDPHFGLYVWGRECGDAFDLKIAKRVTLGAVDRLIETAPPTKTAVMLLLGDVLHMNDQTNQTPAHKHQLDADTRFLQVIEVGVETFRHAALRMLEKHERVILKVIPGNHDPEAHIAIVIGLAGYFHNEPRITVDRTPGKHWFYRFGKVLLGSTHGDTVKQEQLLGVMACDRAADWGITKHRHWLCGHVHHSSVKEFPGVTVETFRTLAAADAYAAGHGYRAGRDLRAIVYHREHGEVERHRCDIGMLEEEPSA